MDTEYSFMWPRVLRGTEDSGISREKEWTNLSILKTISTKHPGSAERLTEIALSLTPLPESTVSASEDPETPASDQHADD